MGEQINVHVVKFGDRKWLQMQFTDPMTDLKRTRSTGTTDRTQAERVAAKWEAELREGRYHAPFKIGWDDFRERYETELVPSLAPKTGCLVATVFNAVERILRPQRLQHLTAERLSYFQATLREQKLAEATIGSYLGHLRSALQWAVDVGMLSAVPKVKRTKRAKAAKLMKGRPVTTEEFERMLARISEVMETPFKALARRKGSYNPPAWLSRAVESWGYLLRGLWLSGLRLSEALDLWWDRPERLCVDLSGKRQMFRIHAEMEKGGKDRILPMAPEFAEFLCCTPPEERTGRVFKLVGWGGRERAFKLVWVSKTISRFGMAAKVKVNTDTRTGKVKWASAHDLRRSFGERWAKRIMPQVLMELMRHESFETTLRYYVGRNAVSTADLLWEAHEAHCGNTSGNSGGQPAETLGDHSSEVHISQEVWEGAARIRTGE